MYELLKKLKECGYKSEHQMDMDTGAWCVKCPYDRDNKNNEGFEEMCYPSSDELIEELGDITFRLYRDKDETSDRKFFIHEEELGGPYFGSLPKEALIKLYIKIHGE